MKTTISKSKPFTDLSVVESTKTYGGSSFAYDAGRVLRFLGIAAGGLQGPTFAIADWITTSYLEE